MGQIMKRYHLNNNTTITSNYIGQWAKTKKVHFDFTVFYLPNENGLAERDIRIYIKKLRSLMAGCDLPKKLCPLDLSTTIYFKNGSPIKVIKEGITPIQTLTNTVLDLSHLRIWRYIAYLRLPEKTLVKNKKFYLISKQYFFVGYSSYLGLL